MARFAEVLIEPAPEDRILVLGQSVAVATLPDGTRINIVVCGRTCEITIDKKRYWADITPIVDAALKQYREA